MSHIVTITNIKATDMKVLAAAVARIAGAKLTVGTGPVQIFAAKVNCIAQVQLPGWKYPVGVEADGTIKADNYKGAWGAQEHMDRLRQLYAAEAAKAAARKQGYTVTERVGKEGKIVLEATR